MTLKTIREGKFAKVIASYLAIQMFLQMVQPASLYALTSGPSQPEFNSFTPIGTSDMVDLTTGDFSYNIPLMDVGGYPINLSYSPNIGMDQEASWVGLGWNLNVGQINRQVRGIPDDFKGDEMRYENDMKENITVGTGFSVRGGLFGIDLSLLGGENGGLALGLDVQYNNYSGITFQPSFGLSYGLFDKMGVGIDFSSSTAGGAMVNPSASFNSQFETNSKYNISNSKSVSSVGLGYSSRQMVNDLSLNHSITSVERVNMPAFLFGGAGSDGYSGGQAAGASLNFNEKTYTPAKRAGMSNGNFTFRGSFGTTFFGPDLDFQISGLGAFQKIRNSEKDKKIPAYGYANTAFGQGSNVVHDFIREKDRSFNKHTTVLPVTNYTHDLYSINGQGIGGIFRSFKGQVGHVYDNEVKDVGGGGALGIKFGSGNLWYTGVDVKANISSSKTRRWTGKNYALPKFKETPNDDNGIKYEAAYFKTIGEMDVDPQLELFNDNLSAEAPMRLHLNGGKFNRRVNPIYRVKQVGSNGLPTYTDKDIDNKIVRTERFTRNQAIQSISNKEARNDALINSRTGFPEHHTVGMKIMKPDGSTYIYGESAYNTKKVEATFDVAGQTATANCADGLVSYSGTGPGNNSNRSDQFLNRITTPNYAHTYLISGVVSADYEDLTRNGLTDDDLGTYTKFTYETINNYKWRIPYDNTKASYNEGLKSNSDDEKGNYTYGEKELKYVKKIETKTHVALFHFEDRKDARGAKGEHPGSSGTEASMRKISKISLYSKPEYQQFQSVLEDNDPSNDPGLDQLTAIKNVFFEYDYSLCKGVPNNLDATTEGGKLTLKKVFFTYRGSQMGKHTPYIFNYDGFNPDYNLKGYDIWGNFKPVVSDEDENNDQLLEVDRNANGDITNVEYINPTNAFCGVNDLLTAPESPYVQQEDPQLQDAFARAWVLTSIDLPSGGKLTVETESDDYAYVQDKKVMQLFNVVGAGSSPVPSGNNPNTPRLYGALPGGHNNYLYVQVSDEDISANLNANEIIPRYFGSHINEPIYFKFLLNMTSNNHQHDYVSGYFEVDGGQAMDVFVNDGKTYISVPMRTLDREGGWINSNAQVNPISKAGWYFGRTYLNREVYSLGGDSNNDNFVSIVSDLISSLGAIFEVFNGPNGKLQNKQCARDFKPDKSWIRLQNPEGEKLGGGCRVASITLQDNWDVMTDNTGDTAYSQMYGQVYDYTEDNGKTSGVATFEPNGSKENPLVMPFFDADPNSKKDKLVAPSEFNFVEKPIGESFFPSAVVTYRKVTVKNLPRSRNNPDYDPADPGSSETLIVRKNATGKVVTEHYTSFDYPTITDYTDVQMSNDRTPFLANLLNFNVRERNHITMSQGFSVITNNMNGKMRKQRVFAEGQDKFISGVDYFYFDDGNKRLVNTVPTIDKEGNVGESIIGQHYDVVNDFRESSSKLTSAGVNTNFTAFLVAIFPGMVIIPLPEFARHEEQFRAATTTKVIHKTAIMKEKIAYDLGSNVSTKYIAWDAHTGQPLLSETINEYDDNYYNLTYPTHWINKGMDKATLNLGVEGIVNSTDETGLFRVTDVFGNAVPDVGECFYPGDELDVYDNDTDQFIGHYWVGALKDIDGNQVNDRVLLIDRTGKAVNECDDDTVTYRFKIMRSGYQNQQTASMASVTSMVNPINIASNQGLTTDTFDNNSDPIGFNPARIINASAVLYNDFWIPQTEFQLPLFLGDVYVTDDNVDPLLLRFNPFLYNVKGEYRAERSYAYLTNRNRVDVEGTSPRTEGYFKDFSPFYRPDGNGNWELHPDAVNNDNDRGWTFASEVTQYSPYGTELENRDAIDRYSAAQYGYHFVYPIAVASNSQYREIGYDGFEDYDYIPLSGTTNPHFSFIDLTSNLAVQRTDQESHTGRFSLQIQDGDSVSIVNNLEGCTASPRTITCPDDPVSIEVPPNGTGCPAGGRSETFILTGTPGQLLNIDVGFSLGGDPSNCDLGHNATFSGDVSGSQAVINSEGTATVTIFMDFDGVSRSSSPATFRITFETVPDGANTVSNTYGPYIYSVCDDLGCTDPGDPTGFSEPETTPTIHTIPDIGIPGGGISTGNCSSFRPIPENKRYVVSGWVKEDHDTQQQNYSNSSIKIRFSGAFTGTPLFEFEPTGQVIDGWQRITGIFTVPEGAERIQIELEDTANGVNTFFDDIRIYPFNGNMKTFVYDPINQRLLAELDENNYATFYDYDTREGGLVRVKKETERGVFTIQETRSGNNKLNAGN